LNYQALALREPAMKKTIELTESAGRLTVHLSAQPIGSDWNIAIYGGDRPHIGAVAVVSQRQSCSLVCLPGHKEGDMAKRFATALADSVNATVCVSCGIHLDDISSEEINQVLAMADRFLSVLKNKCAWGKVLN
jgi:hypothetical protein